MQCKVALGLEERARARLSAPAIVAVIMQTHEGGVHPDLHEDVRRDLQCRVARHRPARDIRLVRHDHGQDPGAAQSIRGSGRAGLDADLSQRTRRQCQPPGAANLVENAVPIEEDRRAAPGQLRDGSEHHRARSGIRIGHRIHAVPPRRQQARAGSQAAHVPGSRRDQPYSCAVFNNGIGAKRMTVEDGRTQIFADGADRSGILELRRHPLIRGFTTNPTLMRKAGVEDYEAFALDIIGLVPDRPISFEVFSDDHDGMIRQALKIATWGEHVHVKIPVTDTSGRSTATVQRALASEGVQLNVTALLTLEQVEAVAEALDGVPHAYVSVFAGRIADTGVDPVPIMSDALEILRDHPNLELLWASPREILNVVQARQMGCHVITVTHDILRKLDMLGRDLTELSLDTVRMFHRDAELSGYSL